MDNSNAANHELGAIKTPNLEAAVLELTPLMWIDNKTFKCQSEILLKRVVYNKH